MCVWRECVNVRMCVNGLNVCVWRGDACACVNVSVGALELQDESIGVAKVNQSVSCRDVDRHRRCSLPFLVVMRTPHCSCIRKIHA